MAAPLSVEQQERLVDALADAAWHSGEDLARAAGITRAALAKRVDKLREWGLDIEARQGLGYRMARPLERLDLQRLSRGLPAALQLQLLSQTDSTNRVLMEAAPERDPQACLAEHQTAGRGRRGRVWRSPYGANLYLSLAWSWRAWPTQLTTLPLAVGSVVASVLRAQGLRDIGVKWPNDLYSGARKLGGVLIEQRGEAGGACRVVVGLGLNIAMSQRQAHGVDQAWISLQDALAAEGLPPASRNALASALLAALYPLLQDFPLTGFSPYAPTWAEFDLTRDQPVQVQVQVLGSESFSGIARGIDADGGLRIEAADGWHSVHSGDVSLRLG